jgi:hypothetical protein
MKTLEQKINDLKDDHAKELALLTSQGHWEEITGSKCVEFDSFRTFKPETVEDLQRLLNALEPYNTSHEIKGASTKNFLGYMYRLDIANDINQEPKVKIQFNLVDLKNIWVTFPLSMINEIKEYTFTDEFLHRSYREVTDSEYHYFTGSSYKQIREMRLPRLTFKGKNIGWYGGGCTSLCDLKSKEMINYILNK